jgi:hypothetical protein
MWESIPIVCPDLIAPSFRSEAVSVNITLTSAEVSTLHDKNFLTLASTAHEALADGVIGV